MANEGYEQQFQSAALGPGWMHGPWGQKFWAAVGRVLDGQNDRMRSARVACMPDGAVAVSISEALDRQGDDRLLPRGGTAPDQSDEADATYAARLKAAWDTWGQDDEDGGGGGSVKGVLTQLKIAGFPVDPEGADGWENGAFLINHLGRMYQLNVGELTVVGDAAICLNRQNLDGTVSGTLPGWTLDARDQFYSKWMLVFVEDVPELTDTDCPAKRRLNNICHTWKSASAIYCGCAIVPYADSATAWGFPIATEWGQADLDWGTNDARFINPE